MCRSRESAPLYHQSKPHSDSGGTKWLVIGILVYSSKVLSRSEPLKHPHPHPDIGYCYVLGGGKNREGGSRGGGDVLPQNNQRNLKETSFFSDL